MSDLISVSSLLKNSTQIEFHHGDGTTATYIAVKAIELEQRFNSVDAEPVRHGHWKKTEDGAALCSACNRKMNPVLYGYARCALCGARMDGDSE